MEQNRQQPGQTDPQADMDRSEVVLEPIQDLGIGKARSADKKRASKKRRARRRKMIVILGVTAAVLLAVVVFLFVSRQRELAAEAAAQIAAEEALRAQQEQERKEFQEMANSTIFLNGVTVNGVSIGGMTMDEAKAALLPITQNLSAARQIELTYNGTLYPLDLTNMSYSTDLDDVLKDAYVLGKTGDYASMKAEKADVETNGRAFTLSVSYDVVALQAGIAQIAAQIDAAAQDASIQLDVDAHAIVFTDEVVGRSVDQPQLLQRIADALLAGTVAPVEIPVVETQPAVTRASTGRQIRLPLEVLHEFLPQSEFAQIQHPQRRGAYQRHRAQTRRSVLHKRRPRHPQQGERLEGSERL
jgi:hypothetical protein